MISPLVYIFAGAAFIVALLFVLTALLTYRHARTRTERRGLLYDYMANNFGHLLEADAVTGDRYELRFQPQARRLRASVMHLTIGDLVRDEELAAAADAAARDKNKRRSNPAGPEEA